MTYTFRGQLLFYNSMVKSDYQEVLRHLLEDGVYAFGEILDPKKSEALYHHALQQKNLGPGMFLSEAEYLANPQHLGVNPSKGHNNFLEKFEEELHFVEQEPYLNAIIKKLLGNDYEIFLKKFVCGVPSGWIPDWLKERLKNSPANNLGAYVRPEYRDITYFYGIDFHQDAIDWANSRGLVNASDLLTMYIYIHPVTTQDAPLYVLLKSHKFGASMFPHHLERQGESNDWLYADDNGHSMICSHRMLVGNAGYVALWHSSLLHGTQGISPALEGSGNAARLSLRYLLRRSQTEKHTGLDEINASIEAPLSLDYSRNDLDKEGKNTLKSNTINNIA